MKIHAILKHCGTHLAPVICVGTLCEDIAAAFVKFAIAARIDQALVCRPQVNAKALLALPARTAPATTMFPAS